MKRITSKLFLHFISLLLIVLSQVVVAQDYKPLAIDGATWVIGYAPQIWENTDFYAYKIEGDSTVNNVTYKKVYRYDLLDNVMNPYEIVSKDFYALIREDIMDKKVYVHIGNQELFDLANDLCWNTWIFEEELLLIDFDKNIGDTMSDCIVVPSDHLAIEVEQYETRYDEERRVLKSGLGLELIEGVGYEDGLFVNATSIVHAGWGHSLFDYCLGTFEECGLSTSSKEVFIDESLKIFPNPVSNLLTISSDNTIDRLEVFNLLGKRVISSQQKEISVSDIPDGTYILKLYQGDKYQVLNFVVLH